MKSKITVIVSSMLIILLTIGMTTSTYGQEDSKEPKTSKKIKKKRKKFRENKDKALKAMYRTYPESKAKMSESYAYAAFGNTGINLGAVASGNGGGVAHNNVTGAEVYVKMISYGVGVGLGVKKYFAVFLFKNKVAYDNFLNSGWSADAQTEATADTGKEGEGGSLERGITVGAGVTLYQIADKGLALQATVKGTKFIVADELNSK